MGKLSSIKTFKSSQFVIPTPICFYPFNGDILDYATGTGVSNATGVGGTPTFNTSFYKTGTSSLILTGSNSITLPSFTMSNNMTFCLWFSTANSVVGSTLFYYTAQFGLELGYTNNLIVVNSTTNISGISGSNFASTAWTHVAITVSGATIVAYVNGTFIKSSTLATGALSSTASATIGVGYTHNFVGNMNNYRVYNSTLTSTQIAVIYNTSI